ncbi:uncharacterized protein G2W53_023842 [Senna tora]|uniref:Uncharacterized protein n=1 Tax=Senna tora TaxID=362788 RepID=A0A834TCF9_9FABA|nr:uncharacterized protein G2W53_023842 [Senna tora]
MSRTAATRSERRGVQQMVRKRRTLKTEGVANELGIVLLVRLRPTSPLPKRMGKL